MDNSTSPINPATFLLNLGVCCLNELSHFCAHAEIEHYFDKETLNTLFSGKHFADGNKVQTSMQFSKVVSALKVVDANGKHIDFSAFGGLLNDVSAVINDHAKRPLPAKVSTAPI